MMISDKSEDSLSAKLHPLENFKASSQSSNKKLPPNKYSHIKIANRRLPSDFFRPPAYETLHVRPNTYRDEATRTPCFGQRPEINSVEQLLQKKMNTQCFQRVETLPADTHFSMENSKRINRHSQKRQKTESGRHHYQRLHNRREQHYSMDKKQLKQCSKLMVTNKNLNSLIVAEGPLDKELAIKLNFHRFFSENNEFAPLKMSQPKGKLSSKPKNPRLPSII